MTRCACRPSCLTWLRSSDTVVQTADGPALAEHLGVQPYPDALESNVTAEILEMAAP